MIPGPELSAVHARLEKLERQNRRMKGIGFAVLLVFGSAFLMGQAAPTPKVIKAERFEVVDANGKGRAVLAVYPDRSAGLTIFGVNGKPRATLGVQPSQTPSIDPSDIPRLSLIDANGKERVSLRLDFLGSGLAQNDANGKPRSALGLTSTGHPHLYLWDAKGKSHWATP